MQARARHREQIDKAEAHLRQGRLAEAGRALSGAERAAPGHVLNHYYWGYMAYVQGYRQVARQHFERASRAAPKDEWSRYMLALTLEDGAPRDALLTGLASNGKEATLREAARTTLGPRIRPRAGGLSLELELGAGLDTNPESFAAPTTMLRASKPPLPTTEVPSGKLATPTSAAAAMALRGRIAAAYHLELAPGHAAGLGVHLQEQGYTASSDDHAAQTEVAGWASYGLSMGQRVELGASYGYSLLLSGHEPLMSYHEADLTTRVRLRSWLVVLGGAGLRWLDVHAGSDLYKDTLQLCGSAALRAFWKGQTLQAGYSVLRSWSEPGGFTLSEHEVMGKGGANVYVTDSSSTAHGPRLLLGFSLPWRLRLDTTVWLLWHHFDQPDRFVLQPNDAVLWEEERQDVQILVGVELRRPLTHGLEAVVLFSAVDNLSSLDNSAPINRSYSRRLLLGSLRWRWPVR